MSNPTYLTSISTRAASGFRSRVKISIDSGPRLRRLESSQDSLLASMHERKTFSPPGCYIGEGQGVQVAALDVGATMSYQIRF